MPAVARAAAPAATGAAPSKKRRRVQAETPTAAAASAPAPIDGFGSAKKQRVEEVSALAKDAIIKLLGDKLSYEVTADEWNRLVELTQQHANFEKHFTFPHDTEDGWVTPKAKKKSTHLNIVALDCEMCVTAPLSDRHARKSNALIRVSAVNGEDMVRHIVSDIIVHQPEDGYRMVDPKTDIHGITLAMIEQSKISVAKAQKHLLKFINADTIVVGHSVHGDLASLRINHRRVIDTALIFQRKAGNPSRATPGLKCLTKFLLDFEMPDGHDSAIDAQASMLAAKYAARHECGAIIPSATELHGPRVEPRRGATPLEPSGPPQLVPSAFTMAADGAADATAPAVSTRVPLTFQLSEEKLMARSCRLRVHRVCRGVEAEDIKQFFTQQTSVAPMLVENITWLQKQNKGSTYATFRSPQHAALAFATIESKSEELDSIGRPQKVVAITSKSGKTFKNIKVGVM
ncbi:hypothetical protein PINS_up003055 [Pythium insidiosum]|nr:hypothetical protein PINS_up003055 [Pythium insidiosum]